MSSVHPARRRLLNATLAAASLPLLSGCQSLIEAVAGSCPQDPAESGGVDWVPDVMHPVFYGFKDYSTADGAPGTVRMWYPSVDGSPQNAAMLKLCVTRWPVVLFLHGQPPCPIANYHQRWSFIPMVLARSGYVVVVPSHPAVLPTADNNAAATVLPFLDWTRSGWEHRQWVDTRAEMTAVAGHSYGSLLAARVKQARPSIAAYVGLSGPWNELNDFPALLGALDVPKFFMWSTGDPLRQAFEDLDQLKQWPVLAPPKVAAVHPGFHFEPLGPQRECSFDLGNCTLFPLVTGELIALFLARYLPLPLSRTKIPIDLRPPAVSLTQKQQFFAGGWLGGSAAFQTRAGCRIDLRWQDGASGSRRLGP